MNNCGRQQVIASKKNVRVVLAWMQYTRTCNLGVAISEYIIIIARCIFHHDGDSNALTLSETGKVHDAHEKATV